MFTRADLDALLEDPGTPAVSIYLPTHVAGREVRQDPIRFRKLLDEARRQLEANGMRGSEADAFLAPANALLNREHYWRRQARGLAVFLAPGRFHEHRLDVQVPERLLIAPHFHVKPLLPLFELDGKFLLLCLALKRVALFQGDRFGLHQIPLDELPAGIEAVMGEPDEEGRINWRVPETQAQGGTGGSNRGMAGGQDHPEANLGGTMNWLSELDRMVHRRFANDPAPLVVIGTEDVVGEWAKITRMTDRMASRLHKNPFGLDQDTLHRIAFEAVKPVLDVKRSEPVSDLKPGAPLSAWELTDVIAAAVQGRVDRLLVACDAEAWGRLDEGSGRAFPHLRYEPGDEDLLDRAAALALKTGAPVHALRRDEMPDGRMIAARLRY